MKLLTRDRSDQHKRDAHKIIEALENGDIPHGASEVAWYTAARFLMARIEYVNARAQGWEDDYAAHAERTGEKYAALHDAATELLAAYDEEEEEHGFPFNFRLRNAHRALRSLVSPSS